MTRLTISLGGAPLCGSFGQRDRRGVQGLGSFAARVWETPETTREKLLTIHEHLGFLLIDVVLREPLDEELQEIRGWLEELPAT